MERVHEYYDFILPLVLEAGKVLTAVDNIEVEYKGQTPWNLVTEYDRKIEAVLIEKIKQKYPGHKYIGEEETEARGAIPTLTDDPTWIIDPIDGTANFVRRMPLTGISVGLTVGREQALGVVYLPFVDELFSAVKGEGAFLNGKRIRVSACDEIEKSVFNYEISVARENDYYYDLYMYRFKHLIRVVQGFRSLGCVVAALCYVACGRTDAYQCDGLYPWDAAAASLVLTEAGGHIVDSSGKEFDLMNPNFLATSTARLAGQYLEVERRADEESLNDRKRTEPFAP